MKFIDYVFFNIYRWYNAMKTNGRNVNPTSATAMMFSICVVGWSICLILFYSDFITKINYFRNSNNKYIFALIGLLSYGIVNSYYSSKDRYLTIYNKFSAGVSNRKNTILLSFIFIILPYIVILLFCILKVLVPLPSF